jgi:hypothetical protein
MIFLIALYLSENIMLPYELTLKHLGEIKIEPCCFVKLPFAF